MEDIRHKNLPEIINITLSASSDSGETVASYASLEIVREQGRPRTTALILIMHVEPILMGNASSLTLTSNILGIDVRSNSAPTGGDPEAKFIVAQKPTRGLLTLSSGVRPKSPSSAVTGQPVTRFKAGDLLSGRLQYTYLGRVVTPTGSDSKIENDANGEDSIMVEALFPLKGLPLNKIGPLKLRFRPVQIDQAYIMSY